MPQPSSQALFPASRLAHCNRKSVRPAPRVLLAWLALRDHKAPRGRLDRKAFQDLPRRAAASVYQLVCAAIVWAEQFSPATDCR